MNSMSARPKLLSVLLFPALVILFASCGQDSMGPDVADDLDPQLNVASSGEIWIGAGDIATCLNDHDEETAQVVDSLLIEHPNATVFTAGDNVYEDGTAQEYADCYEPTWGRFKDRTWATMGNHEYRVPGATPTYDYFGARVGPRDLGYYSLDVGDWHIVALNSGSGSTVPMDAGSAQEQWLRADLAATDKSCIMAVFHHARFKSCPADNNACVIEEDTRTADLWQALYDYGTDLAVVGHVHRYERWAPVDGSGNADPAGIRQFIVGTGGRSVGGLPKYKFGPNIEEIGTDDVYGVLKLTLRTNAYDWEFVQAPGTATYTDAGTAFCGGPGPSADFTWSTTALDVAFTDASTDPDGTVVGWNWDFGDGNTSTAQNPGYTYSEGGTYTVTLTVTDNDGTTGTTSKSVPVGPQAPTAEFGWSATNLEATFTDASTDPDGTVIGWDWDFGDGGTSTAQSPIHLYNDFGSYTVTLTVTDNDGGTDIVSKEVLLSGTAAGDVVYVSAQNSSASAGGLSFTDEDIVAYDVATDTWSMFFDGSDVGMTSGTQDIDALAILPDGDLLLSTKDLTTLPGMGSVDENDIVRFSGTTGENTAGTFSSYLVGADVGLAGEDVDAITFAPDGRLVVSTSGSFSVPGVSGSDEDLIALNHDGTTWSLYFEGADVGLDETSDEEIDGAWIDPETGGIYLTVPGAFDVPGLSGDASDVFLCTPGSLGPTTTCTFSPYLTGSAVGLVGVQVIGVHIDKAGTPPANSVPEATEVTITGTAEVGQELTGSYAYGDVDGDQEGISTFRWMRDGQEINGATLSFYTLVGADEGTDIVFEVTPVAATGASPGTPVQSPGAVSATQSTVVATPTSISTDSETSNITVTALDAAGNPVQGASVVLGVTGSGTTLTQPAAVTE
jgi:PKD repeat protein